MKLPRLQFTVRRVMSAVAGLALALWLVVPAVNILNNPARRALTHLWQLPDGSYLFSTHPVDFWTRYRRELIGLPWNCSFEMCKANERACREIDSGKTPDAMIRAHPEVVTQRPSNK